MTTYGYVLRYVKNIGVKTWLTVVSFFQYL